MLTMVGMCIPAESSYRSEKERLKGIGRDSCQGWGREFESRFPLQNQILSGGGIKLA